VAQTPQMDAPQTGICPVPPVPAYLKHNGLLINITIWKTLKQPLPLYIIPEGQKDLYPKTYHNQQGEFSQNKASPVFFIFL
jgi:hypothetical protein